MKFATITDTQGRRIASLSINELTALQTRCKAHQAECAQRGLTVKPQIAMICAAVEYFCNDMHGPLVAAFQHFSELRQECIHRGYTVPPIVGTPGSGQIFAICNLLEQAIAATEPLPGEAPELTRRIGDDYRQAIKNAIDTLNKLTRGDNPQ